MVATLKDVAEKAGVSRSAVSRTFTDGASVSAAMRARVEKAADALGYSPNVLARSLTTRRTKMIGLVSNNFHNPVFLQVFDQFTRGLQDRDLRPLLVNLTDETNPKESVRMLQQYSVDGVVVASSTLPPAFAEAFSAVGLPTVHTFGRYSPTPKTHVVGVDNVACGRMAAQTLIARGYKRVAFLGGPQAATSTQDRLAGFSQEIELASDIDMTISFAAAYSFTAGQDEMARLVVKGSMAEAYFCGDDVLSIGVVSALKAAKLAVPADVGVIGMNDMEMAGWQNIDLTTIHQPIKQIVTSSIELMVSLLEHSDRHPEARLIPCGLVERGTLRPLP